MNHAIILYDNTCGLCQRTVLFILKRDPHAQFRFAGLQSKTAKQVLHSLQFIPSPNLDTIILIEDAQLYFRSAAFFRIMKKLPFPWKSLAIFLYVPRIIRDLFYRFFIRFRFKLFGKKEALHIPHQWQSRFLDAHEQACTL